MSKFNKAGATAVLPRGPITTTGPVTNHAGGAGFARDAKGELFTLALTYMGGDATFYEAAGDREKRFIALVHLVAVQDADWLVRFIPWLRNEANMRTASLVAAAEAVKARLDAKVSDKPGEMELGPSRRLVAGSIHRADEPGEFVAYWMSRYGRKLPAPVKRGVADAVRASYNEYSLLKYDTGSHGVRFADVIDLVHPFPDADKPWQGDLFKYALDRRHERGNEPPERLTMIRSRAALMALPVKERRKVLLSPTGPQQLKNAGMTWESLAGWLQGPMDKAAWEAIIPSMGFMALIRNLRNFDEAGVSDTIAAVIAARFTDPVEVAKSRQFPYRFLSAYRAAPSLRWAQALETAFGYTCASLPDMPGRSLVLVDTSGSMQSPVSAQSKIRHVDVGALIGVAIARKCGVENVDLIGFATGAFLHPLAKGGSAMKEMDKFTAKIGCVGMGTETYAALKATYAGHKRVIIVTDGQAFNDWRGHVSTAVPANVPMFAIDTTGYKPGLLDTSNPGRYQVSGFSDKVFMMFASLSAGDVSWPF